MENKPVEFDKWFNYLAFDVIGEITFSKAFGFLETGTDVGGSVEKSQILTLYVAVMGYFQTIHNLTLGNPLIGKLGLTPSQHIFDTVRRAVTARKTNPDKRADMLEQPAFLSCNFCTDRENVTLSLIYIIPVELNQKLPAQVRKQLRGHNGKKSGRAQC